MGAHLSTRQARTHVQLELGVQPSVAVKALPPLPSVVNTVILDIPLTQRCSICMENDVDFPSSPPTPGCTHRIDVCVSCLRSYVCSGIKSALNLRCPSLNCIGQMDVDEIRASLGESHKEEFERQVLSQNL
jgi:hypothetical protein